MYIDSMDLEFQITVVLVKSTNELVLLESLTYSLGRIKGREIENYINPDKLDAAIRKLYPKVIRNSEVGQYNDSLQYKRNGKAFNVDKIKLAKEVVDSTVDFGLLDLDSQIRKKFDYIQQANGLDNTRR